MEEELGLRIGNLLTSVFCRDLLIKELPTLSHQPVSMAHCQGQRYIENTR